MNFEVGDVVALRSGGRKMTVKAVMPEGIECVYWFRNVAVEETFPPTVLELVDVKRS